MASIDVTVTTAPITVTVDDGTTVTVGAGTVGPAGPKGDAGTNGQGVPTGGTTGQVLAKKTGTNYDTEWVDQSGGGGGGSGTVTSVTGTAPISVATGTTTPVVSIAAASTSAAGSMSAADKSKLDGVEAAATANATNAQLRDRATHTGTQTLSTISDAGTAAAKDAPATGNASATEVVMGSDTRLTDARTPSSTLSHASTHGAAGSDPLTLAQSQVTNLTTDLASKVPTSRTVNGKALSSDVTLTASDLSLATIASSGSASDLSTGTVPTARLASKVVGGQDEGATLNEPSVATSFLDSPITLPSCAAGDVLLINAAFTFLQNSGGARTITFGIKLGSTTIMSSGLSISQSATTRSGQLVAALRVEGTSDVNGSMSVLLNNLSAPYVAHGVATENIGSGSLAFDFLITATNNATQQYALQYLTVTRIAA